MDGGGNGRRNIRPQLCFMEVEVEREATEVALA
jgi:hypothetical protein